MNILCLSKFLYFKYTGVYFISLSETQKVATQKNDKKIRLAAIVS